MNGKVAHLEGEYKIVITLGDRSGVKLGQKFVVYEVGPDIKDPDNPNLSLGKLETPKGRFEVTHVQSNISTAIFDEYVSRPGPFDVLSAPQRRRRPPNIQVGDLVRSSS